MIYQVSYVTDSPNGASKRTLVMFMKRSVEEMQVALRALYALADGRQPDQQDVEQLHRIISAAGYDSLDEMACAVIEQALDHRRRVRDAWRKAEEQLTLDWQL